MNLTPGQDEVVKLLAKFLAAARRGELDAVVIAACGASGNMETDFRGTAGFECQLNMGLDFLKGTVKGSFLHTAAPIALTLQGEGVRPS